MHDLILSHLLLTTPASNNLRTSEVPASTVAIMSNNGDGVNPLRPYYIPPTIGEAPDVQPAARPSYSRGNATTGSGYASKARDMLQDLDYNYLNESQPSMVQNVKDMVDELIWKYTSVLMAQPFEVAKMILQTRDQDTNNLLASPQTPEQSMRRTSSYGSSAYDVSGLHRSLRPSAY
jgi:fusion and transport protein UGO1